MSVSSAARISSAFTSGTRVVDRDDAVAPQRGSRRVPGSSARNMSLRPVRGRSSTLASRRTMSAYSGSTSMRTRARPSSSSTLPMSPDAHAGHAHGLALAGRHPLGVGQLDPHRYRLLLQQREAQPLVGQDVGGHAQAQRHHRAPAPTMSRRWVRSARFTPRPPSSSSVLADHRRVHQRVDGLAPGARVARVLAQRLEPVVALGALLGRQRALAGLTAGLADAGGGVQVGRLLGLARHVRAGTRAAWAAWPGARRPAAAARSRTASGRSRRSAPAWWRRRRPARGSRASWRRPGGSRRTAPPARARTP